MKFPSRQLKYLLVLCLSSCNSIFASSNIISSTFSSIIFAVTIQHVPSAVAFPFDFIFNNKGRKDVREPKRPFPNRKQRIEKPHRYYEIATKILDWAFNELDESDEGKNDPHSPRFDVDKMASSSSEEEEEIKNPKIKSKELKKMTRGIKNVQKNRIGNTTPSRKKTRKAKPKPASTSAEYEDSIEEASVHELKYRLKQMKREEDGIFSTNIFTNPITSSIFSFGTSAFKMMYCGLSGRNSYCAPDHIHSNGGGPASVFQGIGRALAVLTKDERAS